jgi:hypothetical protein
VLQIAVRQFHDASSTRQVLLPIKRLMSSDSDFLDPMQAATNVAGVRGVSRNLSS